MTSESGSGEETTAKKLIAVQTEAMTEKGRQFFKEKNRRHHQLPPPVTPTLVTPLGVRIGTVETQNGRNCFSDVGGVLE